MTMKHVITDYLDSDNEFTTVTKKRKRQFNWSSEKKESPLDKEHRLRDSPDASKALM